jgi:nitrogen fixation protein
MELRQVEEYLLSTKRPDWLWGSASLLMNGYRLSFPGFKAAGVQG